MAAVLASLPGSVGYLAAGLPAGVLADRATWRALRRELAEGISYLAAGCLTVFTVAAAWFAGLRKEVAGARFLDWPP